LVCHDALEAVVTGVASGAKVLGALGAPATGGASLAAASAAGGIATGAFEAGKQALAKGLDLREDFDTNRIVQSGLMGAAAPIVGKGIEKGVGAVGNYFKNSAPKLANESAKIAEAAKRIGIKPALRQQYDDRTISMLEESFEKVPTIIGRGIRKAAENRKAVYDDTVDQIVSKYSSVDPIAPSVILLKFKTVAVNIARFLSAFRKESVAF
jgi:hypothetical protein